MTTRPDRPFVFVSYEHHDIGIVTTLVDQLRRWGVSVWWDHMLAGGALWQGALEGALRDGLCRGLVVALTEQTYASAWVAREMGAARDEGRPILQLRLRPAPPLDARFQVCDLTAWSGSPTDDRLRLLRRDVEATFGLSLA
jgi:hypothetical protein